MPLYDGWDPTLVEEYDIREELFTTRRRRLPVSGAPEYDSLVSIRRDGRENRLSKYGKLGL
jgi:hypothetical protein